MSHVSRLLKNLKIYIQTGVLEEEFEIFAQEYPELDSISELNQLMEDEMSYWDVE